MVQFLALVAGLSYLLAMLAFFVVFAGNGSDIQLILSALAATCGTVAAAGCGIIERLDALKRQAAGDSAPRLGPSGETIG